ncbi:MAG: RAD55 family ATPase [Thermoplasmata archaeon]
MAKRRLSTYIPQLDAAMDGGLCIGHHYMLTGPVGSGKTSLAYYILFSSAKVSSIGSIFVSFTMTEVKIKQMAQAMGFNHEEVARKLILVDRVQLLSLIESYGATQTSLPNILKVKVQNLRETAGCGLVVLDSITAMKIILSIKDPVTEITRFIEMADKLGLTTISINEEDNGKGYSQNGEELFMDGILKTAAQLNPAEGYTYSVVVQKMSGTGFSGMPVILNLYPRPVINKQLLQTTQESDPQQLHQPPILNPPVSPVSASPSPTVFSPPFPPAPSQLNGTDASSADQPPIVKLQGSESQPSGSIPDRSDDEKRSKVRFK